MVVVTAILVGVLLLRPDSAGREASPAAAPTTSAPARPQVHLVLRAQYVVDETSGTCSGTGELEGVGEGAVVEVYDDLEPVRSAIPTITLPAGIEVTAEDARGSVLVPPGDDAACVFTLPPLGYPIEGHERVALSAVAAVDARLAVAISGNDVVYTLGGRPFDPETDLSADGVADPEYEVWGAEIDYLRASASPGRIFGMVLLGGEHSTGAPTSPAQPLCVGIDGFSDIRPGSPIVVTGHSRGVVGEDILRGAAFDGHHGCSHWFVVDVPADVDSYMIAIAGHDPVDVDRTDLDAFGWRIDLWSDAASAQTNCTEAEGPRSPMMCLTMEPASD